MWDPRADRVLGEVMPVADMAREGAGGKVWQALPGFTFGVPDLLRLEPQVVLLTYYATLPGIIHVRACRFQFEFRPARRSLPSVAPLAPPGYDARVPFRTTAGPPRPAGWRE